MIEPWQPHPDAWALVVAFGAAYVYALSAWGRRYAPGARPATRNQKLCFAAGLTTLWIGADWPIHGLSTDLFSVHMVQHLLFSLVAAPLLILGTPGWLVRRALHRQWLFRSVRAITRPLFALLIFNGWLVAYHWPVLLDLSVRNDLVHALVHVVWVVAALIMWWPVLSPVPELPHLSDPGRMVYLFGQSIAPTVPGAFLTFTHVSLYSAYEATPLLYGIVPVHDQQVAGLLMKLVAGLYLWIFIAIMFYRWAARDEQGGPDPLYWRDLEPEMPRAETNGS